MESKQQLPQEQPQQTAETYYDKNRKRSFLFSRITVVTSMLVLVVALTINISLLSSQERTSTKSRASAPVNNQKTLPSLHAGCEYQPTKNGFKVVCPTPTLKQTALAPINIELPKLPPQCILQTSTNGNKIQCSKSHEPIPTVPVSIPVSCASTNQTTILECREGTKQPVIVPLPPLPIGCDYAKIQTKYFVRCNTPEGLPERKGD